MYIGNLLACSQNNLTDGEEDLPEDTFSLLSVLLVGSLNFPFDRSRLAPRRQPSGRPFTRKLWSNLAICIPLLFPSLCFIPRSISRYYSLLFPLLPRVSHTFSLTSVTICLFFAYTSSNTTSFLPACALTFILPFLTFLSVPHRITS